ncbi:hypothetical protein AJ87_30675 [Rhizobium yanglingense]|nr:hypothetical protein AJ87_30675 [Rhizobium yanglingense]
MLRLQRFRAVLADGLDDIGDFRRAVARAQQPIERDRDGLVASRLGPELGEFLLECCELRAVGRAASQIGADIRAHACKLQNRTEVDLLAPEIVVARNLVRIDASAHRILDIGEHLRGKLQLELRKSAVAGGRIRIGRVDGRQVDGVVGRVEADGTDTGKETHRRLGTIVDLCAGQPDKGVLELP